MKEITIDLNNLVESNLPMECYVVLQLIHEDRCEDILPLLVEREYLHELLTMLERNMYIKYFPDDEPIADLREKGLDLFKSEKSVNFEEFFNVFPVTTCDGRVLRVKEKMFNGTKSVGYSKAEKLYLRLVKSQTEHKIAVDIVDKRAKSGDTKYMRNIETYIRNKDWQKDSVKYGDYSTNPDWNRNIANDKTVDL